MSNKSWKRILIIGLVLLLALGSFVYAAKVYEISFTNTFETGSVDVKIEQFEATNEGEKLVVPGVVMPNQDVSYIPRVTNLRADAYVRVKVDINMDKDIPKPITIDEVYGFNDEWVQIGEYFYLKKPLKTEGTSDLFKGFHIPAEWTHETASGFTISLTVDAVQEVNFTPNFDAAAPWGTIEIEQAKLQDNITYGVAKEIAASPTFQYTSMNGLESKTTDLFKNFDYFMAGDSYHDTLEMKNKSDNPVRLYFKTDTEDKDLVSQMQVKISCDGVTFYDGSLHSTPLDEYKELTVLSPGVSKDFEFEVFLPADSKNYYSVLKDNVVWKFRCEEIETPNNSPQTGDYMNLLPYIAAGIIALLALCMLFFGRKKDKKNVQ